VPALGPVDASSGLRASGDASGDAAITFAQGDAPARSVVVALYDAPPGHPHAHNEMRWRRDPRPRFHWSTVVDAWSSTVVYRLEIDHVAVRTSAGTTYVPRAPIPDGDHRWRIVTIDGRGQQDVSHDRFLRIDTHKPKVRVGTTRRGTLVTFRVIVDDGPAGSGAERITIDFGDGTQGGVAPRSGRATHRYARRGSYPIVVTVRDRAGNEATAKGHAQAG
jgi:hypothetical protein